MIANLYATVGKGPRIQILHVPLSSEAQHGIRESFAELERHFSAGRTEDIPFEGGYRPDEDEMLHIDDLVEAQAMRRAAEGNTTALERLSESDLEGRDIRALFVASGPADQRRLLVQSFQRNQMLSRRRGLFLSGDTYNTLSRQGLMLASSLVATIEADRTRFISFSAIKRVFELGEIFQAATDADIHRFAAHPALAVSDADHFIALADQVVRKLVPSIHNSRVLDDYTVDQIHAAATELDVEFEVRDHRIVLPEDKAALKHLLKFLDDGIFRSALTRALYVTNSKRPVVGRA